MGKVKNLIQNLITKIKGEPSAPVTDSLSIQTFKNGTKLLTIKETDSKKIKNFCDLLQAFSKWDDYQIVYDYPKKTIAIYFRVTKAADFEEPKVDKKNKEDKK